MNAWLLADWPVITVAGIVGLMVGSFLNVCIVRLPAGESPVAPRSRCPRCGNQIAWYDNIPLLSWLILRGKCRNCQLPISAQYPIIEAVVGLVWLLAAWYYGPGIKALAGALFGTILLGAVIIDARHESIPESYTLGSMVVGLALGLATGPRGLYVAVLGAVVGFLLLFAVERVADHFFGEGAIGASYSRLMATIGAFLGWPGAILVVLGAATLAGLASIILAMRKRPLVPFGAFLAFAAAVFFVVGQAVVQRYAEFLRAS